MNTKRAVLFGVLLWVFIFVLLSIIMFIPILAEKVLTQHLIFWALLIPLVLLLAKWYFKAEQPTIKRGFLLGLIAIIVGTVLDLIITVPLFVRSYDTFFTDWKLYVGFAEILLLTTYAGFEFDGTFSEEK